LHVGISKTEGSDKSGHVNVQFARQLPLFHLHGGVKMAKKKAAKKKATKKKAAKKKKK